MLGRKEKKTAFQSNIATPMQAVAYGRSALSPSQLPLGKEEVGDQHHGANQPFWCRQGLILEDLTQAFEIPEIALSGCRGGEDVAISGLKSAID